MKEPSLLRKIFPKSLWHSRKNVSTERNERTGNDLDAETEAPSPLTIPNATVPVIQIDHTESSAVNATGSDNPVLIHKGPNLGIQELYTPPEDLPAAVDIIFVHGLTGNAYNTWLSDVKSKTHWPSGLLKIDIPDARILSFGYDADVVGWFSPVSNNRVGNHAENLLGAVIRLRERTKSEDRSIIFVMHSLGGLVVQNALDLSRSSPESHLKKLESNTLGLLFMGTPHFGSDKALWGSFAISMVKIVRKNNESIVNVLKRDSEMLASIQKKFHEVLRLRGQDSAIRITCFYEELDMPVVGTVVEKNSAILPGYSSYGIHANHRGMTKFEDTKNKGYEDVLGELLRWTKQAREAQNQTTDHQECLNSIYFHGLGDREKIVPQPLSGTFSWIWDKTKCDFTQWLETGQGLYWIRGKASSGKSTLMKYIVENARRLSGDSSRPIIVPYFIEGKIQHSLGGKQHSLASTLEGIIRAILWQLLREERRSLSIVLPRYRTMKKSHSVQQWTLDDLQDILTSILAEHHSRPIWIFLDGLDEYPGDLLDVTDLCNKAVDAMSTTVRFCVSSRPEQEIECSIGPSANSLNSVLGIEEHTKPDIILLARQEISRLSSLMDSKTQAEAVEHLTTRANGLFMWVKLASRDVVRSCMNGVVVTIEDVLKRLDILPDKMNELYQEILQSHIEPPKGNLPHDSTDDDGLCMLGVVTFGKRSFNLREFFFIMKGRTVQTDEEQNALRRNIDASTGGLLEHRGGLIAFAHNTVETFILNLARREPYMMRLLEAHHKLADACLLLMHSFESFHSLKSAFKSLSMTDGILLQDLTRYSIYNWLHHYQSATGHREEVGPTQIPPITNEHITHWQKIYLARCWEQPLLMAEDCHPARSALAFVLISVTGHDIFSSQPAPLADADWDPAALFTFSEPWKNHEQDMDFLITIEFAPGYLVSYHARQILEGKMAYIDCLVAKPEDSNDERMEKDWKSWIQRLRNSPKGVRNFQYPASLSHCLPSEFKKLPGQQKGINLSQVLVDQIKVIIWFCIRLELDSLESTKLSQSHNNRLRLSTPLHFAAFNGLEDVVVLLERYGADLTYSLKDSPYSTPLIAGIWGVNEQRHMRSRHDNTIATLLRLDKTRKTLEMCGNSGYLGVATPLNTAVKLYTGFMKHGSSGPYELRGVIELLVGDGAPIDPATRAIARTSYQLRRYFVETKIAEFSSWVSQNSTSAPISIPTALTLPRPPPGPTNATISEFGRGPSQFFNRMAQTYDHDNYWAQPITSVAASQDLFRGTRLRKRVTPTGDRA